MGPTDPRRGCGEERFRFRSIEDARRSHHGTGGGLSGPRGPNVWSLGESDVVENE